MPIYHLYLKPKYSGQGNSVHVRGTDGTHGYFLDNGGGNITYRKLSYAAPRTYNRFRVNEVLPRLRSQSQTAPLRITYASRSVFKVRTPMTGIVSYCKYKLRKQAQIMKKVTGYLSATEYAWANSKPQYTRYEWCHLVAHGFGGKDIEANLVAATAHNNSEQLILESTLYRYRDEPGVSIRVTPTVNKGTCLAERIKYEVLLGGNLVFTHEMNANFGAHPTYTYLASLRSKLRLALNRALAIRSPCGNTLYEQACRGWCQAQYGVPNVKG